MDDLNAKVGNDRDGEILDMFLLGNRNERVSNCVQQMTSRRPKVSMDMKNPRKRNT